ncbi:hypothetical protein RFI_01004 [Reticulomyxa filosa]|uniref:Uncharacterized protein n=1 Tax=Reticulomyxa filosa TaxID=46433 RepID=X6PCW1_RETFI|nr:hypothetical protein RFI_01004 [Reticulomyxa filosa]|eukprot:ETO36056.1 hypothetical protein RFI_01004 [Reticulomyxa filosa]
MFLIIFKHIVSLIQYIIKTNLYQNKMSETKTLKIQELVIIKKYISTDNNNNNNINNNNNNNDNGNENNNTQSSPHHRHQAAKWMKWDNTQERTVHTDHENARQLQTLIEKERQSFHLLCFLHLRRNHHCLLILLQLIFFSCFKVFDRANSMRNIFINIPFSIKHIQLLNEKEQYHHFFSLKTIFSLFARVQIIDIIQLIENYIICFIKIKITVTSNKIHYLADLL